MRLAIGLLGVLSCAACSPEMHRSTAGEQAVGEKAAAGGQAAVGGGGAQGEVPLLFYDAPPGAPYPQARIEGELRREGSCVYLAAASGEKTLLVMPLPTTSWNPTRGTIQFDSTELRFGQRVAFGGRSVEIGSSGEIAETARRAGCDISRAWMVSPQRVQVLDGEE